MATPPPSERVRNRLRQSLEAVSRQRVWNIGILRGPIHSLLEPVARPRVEWFAPRASGHFIADPFGSIRDGRSYVVCEEYDYRKGRGVIASLELVDGHDPTPLEVAIEEPFHLSHPYLFEYSGDMYCVPESADRREVGLYRAIDFPRRWTRAGTALRGIAAADSTVFEHQGRWWLACSDNDEPPDERLLLWHARTPLGPWEPHAANPVKVDRSSARPGGTPFSRGGSLFRPAQDCSRTYGARVVINRVLRLSPTEFEEQRVAVVEPDASDPYPNGLHTISRFNGDTLVDGWRTSLVGPAVPAAVRKEIRKTLDAFHGIVSAARRPA